ncbi:unnamed protein product, partial [Heterosigma akashiwo]
GSVKFLSHGGPNSKVYLKNCLYCHSLPYNLVSVSQLTDLGYTVTFTTWEAVITNRAGDVIAKARRTASMLYELVWDAEMADLHFQSTIDLWHHRCGHISERRIRMMAKAGIIPASSIKATDKLSFCEDCAMAKATRQPHSKKPRFDVATRPLQRLHCDVAGKFPSDSKSSKWMLIVCDEYTRFRRCFFMKHKNEVLPHMQSFISMIQRVTQNNSLLVENIRLDNGTEFSELAAFCDRSGILLEQTGKDNPASNGIAERSNRIVLDMTRVVLRASGLSNYYWSEAAKYSVHTINRTTTSSSRSTTPYQSLFKKKASIDHLRVFGSICYAHRPSETRPGKLQERAVKCKFLSYNALERTYTVLNLATHRLWVTKDVVFDE